MYTDYVTRIMDNVTSDIIKYADPQEPVIIQSVYQEHMAEKWKVPVWGYRAFEI